VDDTRDARTDEGEDAAAGGAEGAVWPMPVSSRRRPVDEWMLVLRAEGLDPEVCRVEGGFSFRVRPEEEARAVAILETWRAENVPTPIPPEATLPVDGHPVHLACAYACMVALLAFHRIAEVNGEYEHLIDVGSAQAAHIMVGEVWRTATALTLHRDLGHVTANVVIGGLFMGVLARRIGAGLALASVLAAGVLGNLANAIYHQAAHDSIGASTAVFGCVGLLGGLEAWRRRRHALPWRGAWVPFGGSVALLAMLGAGGGDTDFGAHLFGLGAGLLLGWALAPFVRAGLPGPAVQGGFAAVGLLGLAAAWWWALVAS